MKKNYRISFCTAVRNRITHLKHTLPKNIKDNQSYQNVQFIILDYGSSDGLGDWIKDNMLKYIQNGVLVYYYYSIPKFFNRANSRNIAFRLADGDIICNLDADNYTGDSFAAYINEEFNNFSDTFLTAYDKNNKFVQRDILGRICCHKSDFIAVGGYDERFQEYGYEDIDLINRLVTLNKTQRIITHSKYLHAITHDNFSRVCEERLYKLFYKLYVRHITYYKSEFALFLNNSNCIFLIVTDIQAKFSEKSNGLDPTDLIAINLSYEKEDCKHGIWVKYKNGAKITLKNSKPATFIESSTGANFNERQYLQITNPSFITEFLLFYS